MFRAQERLLTPPDLRDIAIVFFGTKRSLFFAADQMGLIFSQNHAFEVFNGLVMAL